jgi:hypothetical protein
LVLLMQLYPILRACLEDSRGFWQWIIFCFYQTVTLVSTSYSRVINLCLKAKSFSVLITCGCQEHLDLPMPLEPREEFLNFFVCFSWQSQSCLEPDHFFCVWKINVY